MSSAKELMSKLKKEHGASVVTVGADGFVDYPRIPTGIFPLDLATGGGIPLGKCTVIYGMESSNKTNVTLKCIAEGQRMYPDKFAVFIDAENSLDTKWAEKLGVDVSRIMVVHPDYAEQAVDMIETFLYADDVFMVVLDSIAALTTQNEIESSAEKAVVGGASLVVGKLYRKVTVAQNQMSKSGKIPPAFVAINQVRTKIGVMFGDPECLRGDTLINFADGSSHTIEEVVNEKIDKPVVSLNLDKATFEPARIVKYLNNGKALSSDFIRITAESVDNTGHLFDLYPSYTHNILTEDGWKKASDISKEDVLITRYKHVISGELESFLTGMVFGNVLINTGQCGDTGITFTSEDQRYSAWKAKMLKPFFDVTGTHQSYSLTPTHDMTLFLRKFLGCRHPLGFFTGFSWLSMAVWIMDVGSYYEGEYTLSLRRFADRPEERTYISRFLDVLGLEHVWMSPRKLGFTKGASVTIAANCTQYIPPFLYHLVPDLFRTDMGKAAKLRAGKPIMKMARAKVAHVEAIPAGRVDTLYDLQVEPNNNYLAGGATNGVVVHNSMPGGNIMKFAPSLTIRLYGKNVVEKKVSAVMPLYKEVNVIVKKWKIPILSINSVFKMQMLEYDGNGPGYVEDWNTLSSYLKELGYLAKGEKAGWVMFDEQFKTLDEARTRLYSDPVLLQEARSTIIKELVDRGMLTPTEEENG